jgi:hypothetical protein
MKDWAAVGIIRSSVSKEIAAVCKCHLHSWPRLYPPWLCHKQKGELHRDPSLLFRFAVSPKWTKARTKTMKASQLDRAIFRKITVSLPWPKVQTIWNVRLHELPVTSSVRASFASLSSGRRKSRGVVNVHSSFELRFPDSLRSFLIPEDPS